MRVVQTCLGTLAVVATIALAAPGVRIARAEDQPSVTTVPAAPQSLVLVPKAVPSAVTRVEVEAGPSCSEALPSRVVRDDFFERQQQLKLEEEIARRKAGSPGTAQSTEAGIVLNGRGYNYGADRQPGL